MSIIRKRYTKAEKLAIVNESLEEGVQLSDLSDRYSIHINTISRWRRELAVYKQDAFPGNGNEVLSEEQRELKRLRKELKESQLPVAMMSKILGVSRSGYYKWLKIQPEKSLRSSQLDEHVKKAFSKNFMVYGSPRIAQYLEQNGIYCSKTTVGRRMQSLNLIARKIYWTETLKWKESILAGSLT